MILGHNYWLVTFNFMGWKVNVPDIFLITISTHISSVEMDTIYVSC